MITAGFSFLPVYVQVLLEKLERRNKMIHALEQQVACLATHVRQAEGEREQLAEAVESLRARLRDRPLSQIPYDHLKAELARRTASAVMPLGRVVWPTLTKSFLKPHNRTGEPWSLWEERELVERYRAGQDLQQIAKVNRREWQAIVLRLYRLSMRGHHRQLSDHEINRWRERFFALAGRATRRSWRVGSPSIPFDDLYYKGKQ